MTAKLAAKEKTPPTKQKAKAVGDSLGLDWKKYDLEQFRLGLGVEREHDEVTHGDLLKVGNIVKDHLDEDESYYSDLKKVMGAANAGQWDLVSRIARKKMNR